MLGGKKDLNLEGLWFELALSRWLNKYTKKPGLDLFLKDSEWWCSISKKNLSKKNEKLARYNIRV